MLQKLSNEQLLATARDLATQERALTAKLLECLSEIRSRGLHLERGYPSLFQFCREALGFTESQAHARISAMKLSQELPEVVEKVARGELSLTNAAAAQVFFRQEKKAGKSYSFEAKRELVQSLEGLSTRQCEKVLAELSPSAAPQERLRPVSAGQTELKIVLDEELMRDLQKLKELWSHSLREGTYAELLKRMTRFVLQKVPPLSAGPEKKTRAPRAPKTRAPQFQKSETVGDDVDSPPLGLRISRTRSRYIPRAVAREVWLRDRGRCTYRDSRTGRRCESRHRLQLDHVKPFAIGGEQAVLNLRLYCQAHNLVRLPGRLSC